MSYDNWKTAPPEQPCEWCGEWHGARGAAECEADRRKYEEDAAREQEERDNQAMYEGGDE